MTIAQEKFTPGNWAMKHTSDEVRKRLVWLAMALVALLTLAFVIIVAYAFDIESSDYTEPLLLVALLAFITCVVAYFADKEREQRRENQRLIQRLHETALALDERVARLNKLCQTSADLAGTLDMERISELVVDALVEQVRADAASLVLMNKSKGECIHTRSVGFPSLENDYAEASRMLAGTRGEESPRLGELADLPVVVDQLKAWEKIKSSIAAPVKVSEVIGGALTAIREESFETEDLNLLTTLANMSSRAIESAELHQQLRQSYYRTIQVLARSLAARDPYSAAHGEAVTWLACSLGKGLGLEDKEMEALRTYGPLHDLGKIGISDILLSKQGPLTEEEFEIVRQHGIIGESIIKPLEPGAAALAMIRNHHERWDGQGYPDGLKGKEIPRLACVLAVADVFHAIVSHRPYRGGATPVQALREIRAKSGSQFDPEIVDVLVALWRSGELVDFGYEISRSSLPMETLDLSGSSLTLDPEQMELIN